MKMIKLGLFILTCNISVHANVLTVLQKVVRKNKYSTAAGVGGLLVGSYLLRSDKNYNNLLEQYQKDLVKYEDERSGGLFSQSPAPSKPSFFASRYYQWGFASFIIGIGGFSRLSYCFGQHC